MDELLELLLDYQGTGAFNQYCDRDPALDRSDAPRIRQANLRRYLESFAGAAYILVGEAAGYAGCRFSGIPFTDESQLVGPEQLDWAKGGGWRQSSLKKLWRERSAQIVWPALDGRRDCVLWNAFPWHPFKDEPLTNRRPRKAELQQGAHTLRALLSLFPQAQVLAIGRVSEGLLKRLGIKTTYIRHPSHGGKRAFTTAVKALPRRDLVVGSSAT